MNVIQLLTSVDRDEFAKRWTELYPDNLDEGRDCKAYIGRALALLVAAVPEKTAMKVLVETNHSRYKSEGRESSEEDFVDVGGWGPAEHESDKQFEPEGELSRWGLDFVPWGQWRDMEVIQNELDAKMSDVDLAAHIFEELTWHGLPDAQDQRRDEVMDGVEKVNRAFDTGDFTGYTEINDEWFAKMRAKSDKE